MITDVPPCNTSRKGVTVLVTHLCPTLFATPWSVVRQVPLSLGFSRQEYWSGLPFPSPGDLPEPGMESTPPALPVDSLPPEPQGSPYNQPNSHTLNTNRPKGQTYFMSSTMISKGWHSLRGRLTGCNQACWETVLELLSDVCREKRWKGEVVKATLPICWRLFRIPCTHASCHLHGSKQKLKQINTLSQRKESYPHQEILKMNIRCLLFSR